MRERACTGRGAGAGSPTRGGEAGGGAFFPLLYFFEREGERVQKRGTGARRGRFFAYVRTILLKDLMKIKYFSSSHLIDTRNAREGGEWA